MKKGKLIGKIFGIALVFVMIGVVLLGSSSIVNSTGELDMVNAVEVTPQEQCNCDRSSTGSIGLRNPAAVYCTKMGYEYKTVQTEAGERGICVLPNGDEVDAWAFYRGECATEFSYCAKMGWPVAVEAQSDGYSDKCCTCILPDESHKTVSELLDLVPDCTVASGTQIDAGSHEPAVAEKASELPESFDWRNKDGQDWTTPVKNQGGCGSCWAFSAVGTVEPQYNIFTGNATLDLDLSEQYLVSDCCVQCGSCGGGWPETALEFTQDEGITDEDCFPYTATDCPCSGRCPDWADRLYTIDDTGYVSSNITTIKEYLIDKGPLSVCLGMWGHFDDGIYRCDDDSGANHAVVIVGYNETGGYWIAKNSWGTGWGDNGYFKVGFCECSIENYVYYAVLYPWPVLLSPPDGSAVPSGDTKFQWREEEGATGYHIQIDIVDTFDSTQLIEADPTDVWYTESLSLGTYYWRVKAHLEGEDTPYSPPWRVIVAKDVVQVTTDPDWDYDPTITETDDGKVWVVWRSYRSGGNGIWYKTSSNGGETWSEASSIDLGNMWGEEPAIAQTSDGRIWVTFKSYESGNSDIWYTTSANGGGNWSAPSQITTDPGSDYNPAITQTSDGKIWVAWYSYRSGNADIWYATSSDGGSTWSDAYQLTTDTSSDYDPAITETDDGNVWVVWWSHRSGGSGIWHKTSSDGGETWSAASPVDTGIWGYEPAIAQTSDGRIWVTFYSHESGNDDIWYTTSSDGGATWSDASQFTRFCGHDRDVAATALSSGHLALAWRSDRSCNDDIWYGVIGLMEDINPPPHLDWAENEPTGPDTEQTVTVRAKVCDESGIEDVQLVWWVDGEPQDMVPMSDDGGHNDYSAGDGIYGGQIGPFPLIGTVVEYQIQITDIGGNVVTAPQYPYRFEIIKPFVKTADILLVADEYYYYDQYYQYYADALDNLDYAYDIWNCSLRGNIDGETLNQYLDGIVIWSTPDWGYIGYSETMNNLSSYLDNGGKLFISGQDIGSDIGWLSFYQDYLHAELVRDNVGLYCLNGTPGDPITDGLYVCISGDYGANNQYWPDEIDPISPAETIFTYDPEATAPLSPLEEPAMAVGQAPPGEYLEQRGPGTTIIESSGSGALRVDTGVYKVVYFAFGFEAINGAADRATVMGRVLNWLRPPPQEDWSVPVSIAADIGSAEVVFGANSLATDGYDEGYDYAAPPPPMVGVDAYFYYPENPQLQQKLETSIVAPADSIVWPLDLMYKTEPGVQTQAAIITISWAPEDMANVPDHYVSLTLTDDTGQELADMRSQCSYTFAAEPNILYSFQIKASQLLCLELKAGWNMVSLPIDPGTTDPDEIFPGAAAIYTWNPVTKSYDRPSEIVPGKGYYVLYFEDVTLCLRGVATIDEYSLSGGAGWYMIGGLSVEAEVIVDSGDVYGTLYHWIPADPLADPPVPPHYIGRPLGDLRPGEGYWLLAFTDFSISVVPKPPAS